MLSRHYWSCWFFFENNKFRFCKLLNFSKDSFSTFSFFSCHFAASRKIYVRRCGGTYDTMAMLWTAAAAQKWVRVNQSNLTFLRFACYSTSSTFFGYKEDACSNTLNYDASMLDIPVALTTVTFTSFLIHITCFWDSRWVMRIFSKFRSRCAPFMDDSMKI